MLLNRTRFFAAFLLMLAFTAALHAQLPVNNDAWKARCNLLASSAAAIQSGTPPAVLVAATHGIPGPKFYALGANRSLAAQHYVACTMYYLAAVSAAAGNGDIHDPKFVIDYSISAGAELKLAHYQKLTMEEHVKRTEMKYKKGDRGASLTSAETTAVLDAATTMPLPPPVLHGAHKP